MIIYFTNNTFNAMHYINEVDIYINGQCLRQIGKAIVTGFTPTFFFAQYSQMLDVYDEVQTNEDECGEDQKE